MTTRRFFIGAGAAAAALALGGKTRAAAVETAAPVEASPAPKPTPGPSPLARQLARSLQRDLPKAGLSDELVEKIAGDIEAGFDIAKGFRKGGLANDDEPDTVFLATPQPRRRVSRPSA